MTFKIMKFTSKYCGNCSLLSKSVAQVMPSHPNIVLEEHDVDSELEFTVRHHVATTPTLQFYKDDTLVKEFFGVLSPQKLETAIKEVFGKSA